MLTRNDCERVVDMTLLPDDAAVFEDERLCVLGSRVCGSVVVCPVLVCG